ncbi:hypothetical protein RHMOL_Rhmol11G0211500 [Rhododendron molle]|uniref:Uncharacterized protein n=1 Tax=Rhododendron molle TaxID=49168 RepID=A0ACC0LUK1_RHOML|nr:hypothetical protein RHMOL_Rhmol11G0211500 [Rhododendron molle]
MTAYERARDEQVQKNLAMLKSLGIKDLIASLPALYRSSQRKGTKKQKSKVAIGNDEEFLPPVCEESFGYSSDDSFGSEADKVKCTTRRKKKGGSGNRILRDSQGTQEERHIIEGATSTPPTQPSTDHVEGMSLVAVQPTQLPCIATNNEGLNCTAPRKPRKGGRPQSNTKRTRGITRGLGVQKRLRAEGKIGGVYFPNDKWKPMGQNAQVYTTEVGVVCRMFANLSIPYWKKMTDQDKEPMFVRLAEEFDVDFSHPHVKAVIDYILNGRYSDYRHQLYRRVKSFPTIEEAREHPDAEIDPNYWNHTCDYMKTKEYTNQPVPEGETPMTEDQICDKVLGRAIGYVRGLGYGVRPDTSIKVAHAMRGQLQECTKRADEAERRAEVAEQRAEVAEQRAEVAE